MTGPRDKLKKKERWNYRNDPSNFTDITLKYDFDSLPTSGRAEQDIGHQHTGPCTKTASTCVGKTVKCRQQRNTIWHSMDGSLRGLYGPKPYKNGNNCAKHDKEYDQLGPLASHISDHMGNGKARDGIDNDGDGEIDECDDRDGVETWFGSAMRGTGRDARRPTA